MGKKDGARAGAMSRKPGKVENETGIIRRGTLREFIGFMRNGRPGCTKADGIYISICMTS
jgi:hypothetical protein